MPRRSKDVRRPIPRPRVPDQDRVRADVAHRCEHEFFLIDCFYAPENFWGIFPSREERIAYQQLYPEEFFGTFGFEDDGNRGPGS